MMAVTGYDVFQWPETKAMLHSLDKWANIKYPIKALTIDMNAPDVPIQLEIDDDFVMGRLITGPECMQVYQSPEFKAFSDRLGVYWEKKTKAIKIQIASVDDVVLIVQGYFGEDNSAVSEPHIVSIPSEKS